MSATVKRLAVDLKAGDLVLMADGSFVAIDNVSADHTEGGAQSRNVETGVMETVFEFSGIEVTVEYVDGEFSTFGETDELDVQAGSLT